jgi:hypothetical protein
MRLSATTRVPSGVVRDHQAAIQGLNQKLMKELERRDAENAELKRALNELKAFLEAPRRIVLSTRCGPGRPGTARAPRTR